MHTLIVFNNVIFVMVEHPPGKKIRREMKGKGKGKAAMEEKKGKGRSKKQTGTCVCMYINSMIYCLKVGGVVIHAHFYSA